jgi:hypothetical protein
MELQDLTVKMTTVADSTVDYVAKVAKDSKQQKKKLWEFSGFARIIQ